MKLMKTAVLVALLTIGAVAQQQKSKQPLPISDYMRGAGLIYLEAIDDLRSKCMEDNPAEETGLREDRKRCEAALRSQRFQSLEDRIELTLSESARPEGDKLFYQLLQKAKSATTMMFSALNDYRFVAEFGHSEQDLAKAKSDTDRESDPAEHCYAEARSCDKFGTISLYELDTCLNKVHKASCLRKGWTWGTDETCH